MNRRQAREEAFKLLFQFEINEQSFDLNRLPSNYFQEVVANCMEKSDDIDQQIRKYALNWTLERIAPVEKTILRIAIYEIIYMDEIPKAVSINEAVELAHKYGDDNSSKFINGILSKVE